MVATRVRVTQDGYDRLKATLEQEQTRLEEATRVLRELTGSSDDYDDSGLEEAKQDKAGIEDRLDRLEDQLARAEIISNYQRDHVDLGSIVALRDKGSKEAFEVQLVSTVEAGVLEGDIPKVSDQSPLGKAILGRGPGETFKVVINEKTMEYTLESIS